MGSLLAIVDGAVLLFSAVFAAAVPLIDGQVLFSDWYPLQLVELKRWYGEFYGDYLTVEKPHFFVGLVWLEIAFLWPLSLANVYGIAARRPWAATTSLMAGVSIATSMVVIWFLTVRKPRNEVEPKAHWAAIMSELLGSGRASDKLLQMYVPFMGFAVLAILKGLLARPRRTISTASHATSARKKRA